ncbi:unnamed protein product [Ilex paraguariensis]|uniref:Pentatricopeptide repeat-containing protein n=1 Tax=Ilex paraguariensis TaxID=185542 RepID=A0ABC8UWV9_9AQUA
MKKKTLARLISDRSRPISSKVRSGVVKEKRQTEASSCTKSQPTFVIYELLFIKQPLGCEVVGFGGSFMPSKPNNIQRSFMPSSHEASSLLTFLIQKCSATTFLPKARQLHALILISTPTNLKSPYLDNNIISMYARCGSLIDSQLLFDKMPHRTLVSYNALMAAYSRTHTRAHLVFNLLKQLEDDSLRPNGSTFTSLLQASSWFEDRLLGLALHSHVAKFGCLNDVCVQTSLLLVYLIFEDLESAKEIFIHIGHKDAVAWNSIIFGFMKNGNVKEGLGLFGNMVSSGAVPTQFTYSMVLNACSRLRDYDTGQLAHAQVIVSGATFDLPLQNALLDMYFSCGDLNTAFSVTSRIENPDLVSWNSMIAGYSENGDGERAMDVFVQLSRTPFAKPDGHTFAAVISATAAFPASNYGKPLHAQVKKAGFGRSVYVGSTLISVYFNNGETELAERVFTSISEKDVVLWTDMIAGYSRAGDGESAIKFFCGMSQEGHKIDSFALSSVLSACAELATLKQGEMIQAQAVKTGYDVEMSVCGSLIDMYAKIGDLQPAELIISQVTNPDLKCWNALLGGYGLHGKAEEALRVFSEIPKHGLRPDQVTFLSMLSACGHCGLVDMGKFLWTHMKELGLRAGPKHYSCMVSLLSRAGLLEEAEKMIIASPFVDNYLELWRTLLSACVLTRNTKIGIHAAEQVLSISTEDSATNVLLTNLYAAAGRWDRVKEMRRKIRGMVLEKDPGLSWIEVKNSFHVFTSGDQSQTKVGEMQTELHRLQGNLMRLETYEI